MFNSKLLSKLVLSTALAFSAAAVVSVMPTTVEAQAISGDIVGLVTDASGAVVPNAAVEVANVATGQKAKTTTNAAGEYRFGNLPVGQYNIQVSGAGMQGGSKGVQVQLNKTATANIVAAVGASATTIEVTESAATIDTTTAQIQSNFEAKQVQDLPTASVGLGVLNLSLLSAGVASSGGMGAGTGPSVSGQRPRNNNYTIEGVDNNDKSITGPLVQIPNDAVQSFTLLQNQFSPEFGHSSGGQFNTVVVSGTNNWHGRVYEYFQNRNLNGQDSIVAQGQRSNQQAPSNTRFDDNRFGGQIGGPIIKDKLFFFHNSEYHPIGQALTSNGCAPTAAGYAKLAAQASAGQISQNNFSVLQKYLPAALSQATQADDPCYGSSTIAVNGDAIPVGSIGFSGNNYSNTYTTVNSVDYNMSQKDQIRFRYIYQRNTTLDYSAQLPAFWTTVPTRNHVITFSEYHAFSPKVSNEFRLGYNRYTNSWGVPNISFPGLASFPNLTFDDLNNLSVGPDPNAPQWGVQNTYQLTNNLSWMLGKHNLKFGFEARKSISPSNFIQRQRGDYDYSSLAEYLNDLSPSDYGERSTGTANYIGDQYALYGFGNDEWRLTQHLSLSLGLRYEFTKTPSGLANQAMNSDASVPGLISFHAPTSQKTNFAPRVGFAYSPGTSGNTSIRGGFGIAYDVLYDNLGTLSLPPQLSGTCDVGYAAKNCYWSDTAFLANGGLPMLPPSFSNILEQRSATSSYIPDQKLPYTETWNLGIQHIFAKKYIAEVRYVGTRGIHLPMQSRINVQPVVNGSNYLPTYLSQPSQAELNALPVTLSSLQDSLYNNNGSIVPAWAAAGFTSAVTGFMPYGQSSYNGLQTQLTRNFDNGLQFTAAWTWSHAFDNSTADVASTYLTPRRAQDFQNINADMSTSALDRRHRLTISAIYDLPFFKKDSNWLLKNMVGNWEIAPIYTFQSPEYVTVQSAKDSNENGDSWGDRAFFNSNGVAGTGSGVTPLKNALGEVVAYLANNPNAQYIAAGEGAGYANHGLVIAGRNTLPMPRTNNWDLTVVKRVNLTERQQVEFQAQALNVFNHAQYLPGSINQVNSLGYTGGNDRAMLTPGKGTFNRADQTFSNNPRTMQFALKYIF